MRARFIVYLPENTRLHRSTSRMPSPITYRQGSIGSNPVFLERSYPRKTNKIRGF
jgi:hypothetical protein